VVATAAVLVVGFRGAYVLTPLGGSDAQNYLAYASYLADHHTHPPPSVNPSEYSVPPLYEAVAVVLNFVGHRLPSVAIGVHAQLLAALAWLALVGGSCAALTAARRRLRLAGAAGLALAALWALDAAIELGKINHFSEGQLVSLAGMVALVALTGLIARELWPGHPRRAIAASAIALAYPIVYRMGIMFHPEMTLAVACSVAYLLVVRARRRGWPWRLGAATGVALGIGADVRQSAVIVIVCVGVTVALGGRRQALGFLVAAAVCVALVAGPWWAYSTATWGSPVKLALDRSGHMSTTGEPLSFWISFPIGSLVTHPYRPDFEDQLLPVLHADLWSDWYGSLRNEWSGQSRLTTFTASTQSTLGFGGDALGLAGLALLGLPALVRLVLRRTRSDPDFVAALLAVVAIGGFIAFVLTILRYPQADGKEIKSSYLLFTTPCWAMFAVDSWRRLSARSAFAARVLLPSFAVLYVASYATSLYAILR
jgi:hypothetical protein